MMSVDNECHVPHETPFPELDTGACCVQISQDGPIFREAVAAPEGDVLLLGGPLQFQESAVRHSRWGPGSAEVVLGTILGELRVGVPHSLKATRSVNRMRLLYVLEGHLASGIERLRGRGLDTEGDCKNDRNEGYKPASKRMRPELFHFVPPFH